MICCRQYNTKLYYYNFWINIESHMKIFQNVQNKTPGYYFFTGTNVYGLRNLIQQPSTRPY